MSTPPQQRSTPRSKSRRLEAELAEEKREKAIASEARSADLAAYKEKLRRAVEKGKGIQSEKKVLEEKHAMLEEKHATLEEC